MCFLMCFFDFFYLNSTSLLAADFSPWNAAMVHFVFTSNQCSCFPFNDEEASYGDLWRQSLPNLWVRWRAVVPDHDIEPQFCKCVSLCGRLCFCCLKRCVPQDTPQPIFFIVLCDRRSHNASPRLCSLVYIRCLEGLSSLFEQIARAIRMDPRLLGPSNSVDRTRHVQRRIERHETRMFARDDDVRTRLGLIAARRATRLQQKRKLLHDGIERHLVVKKERNGKRNGRRSGTKESKNKEGHLTLFGTQRLQFFPVFRFRFLFPFLFPFLFSFRFFQKIE